MSFRYKVASVLVAAAVVWGFQAKAQQGQEQGQVVVDTRADLIRDQQEEIRREANAKRGRYRDMDKQTRARLLGEQDKVFALLDGKASSRDLSRQDQLALFNSLETISAIVNRAEDERMICERTRQTGTNVSQTICKTVAQRRAERERAANALPQRAPACPDCDP